MRKRIWYFTDLYKVIFVMLFIAFINFKLSFAIFDTVNAATSLDWDLFWESAKMMGVFVVLLLPGNLLFSYVRGHVLKSVIIKMKTDYISAVFKKNINEFQHDNNALYVSALTNDFNIIERDFVEQVIVIVEAVINFATAILIITLISPIILLMGAGIIVVNIFVSAISSKPVKKHNKERSEMMGSFSGFIKEILSAFHIIKSNDLESRVKATYQDQSTKVQNKQFVIDRILSFIFALQNTNFILTFITLMFVVSYLTIQGAILFAGVVVVAQNIDNIINPVAQLSEALPRIFSVKAIFTRINASLQNQVTHEETSSFETFKNAIEFSNVSFTYGENQVLKHVNLKFEKGKKYLIIGPSGGGKSTMLRLLRKYFNPAEGQIDIDGINLKDIKKMDYFARIANIEQQIFLFEDTLKNNLTLYKDYHEDDIWNAIERAGLKEFVKTHPDGLDRMIVDNGRNISGGEKSRIAIARGLLNQADIIFLDEAFASLDRARATEIESSLLKLKNVTIINVSHVIIDENKGQYDGIIMVRNKDATWMQAL
ncbi:MAG: ABC transporter ATP-binding protein [Acholeplasmataceae bacterium]|nr:ABC transporter ATP-binding protein [Acholeplasmataceae bacterium]